jgi:gluconolactonase
MLFLFLKLFLFGVAVITVSCGNSLLHKAESNQNTDGDPSCSAQRVTAEGAEIMLLGDGFVFTEGPAVTPDGSVYFCDSRGGRLHHWSPASGIREVPAESVYPVGTYMDRDGSLIICSSRNRNLLALRPDGSWDVLAERFEGKRLNSPNDLWIDPKGGIYFTDPDWGRRPSELGGGRVFYLAPDRKRLLAVVEDIRVPNGIVGTRDGSTLYVADNGDFVSHAYTINPDGTLRDKRHFAPWGFDGMTIDREGNVYVTGDSVTVYSPAGAHIETIKTPQRANNLCFGGPDNRTLILACGTGLYALDMRVEGGNPFR